MNVNEGGCPKSTVSRVLDIEDRGRGRVGAKVKRVSDPFLISLILVGTLFHPITSTTFMGRSRRVQSSSSVVEFI